MTSQNGNPLLTPNPGVQDSIDMLNAIPPGASVLGGGVVQPPLASVAPTQMPVAYPPPMQAQEQPRNAQGQFAAPAAPVVPQQPVMPQQPTQPDVDAVYAWPPPITGGANNIAVAQPPMSQPPLFTGNASTITAPPGQPVTPQPAVPQQPVVPQPTVGQPGVAQPTVEQPQAQPQLTPEVQQLLTQYQRLSQQFQAQEAQVSQMRQSQADANIDRQVTSLVNQQVAQHERNYQAQGWTEPQYRNELQQIRSQAEGTFGAVKSQAQRARTMMANAEGKVKMALQQAVVQGVPQEYIMTIANLLQQTDARSMQSMATSNAEVRNLKAQVAALQTAAPPTTYDNSVGAVTGVDTDPRFLTLFSSGQRNSPQDYQRMQQYLNGSALNVPLLGQRG